MKKSPVVDSTRNSDLPRNKLPNQFLQRQRQNAKAPNKDPTSAHMNDDSNEILKHKAINPDEKSKPPHLPHWCLTKSPSIPCKRT